MYAETDFLQNFIFVESQIKMVGEINGYQSYVTSSQYQYYFQQGFQRGYENGYKRNYQYGNNNNGSLNILDTIPQNILNIANY